MVLCKKKYQLYFINLRKVSSHLPVTFTLANCCVTAVGSIGRHLVHLPLPPPSTGHSQIFSPPLPSSPPFQHSSSSFLRFLSSP